VAPVVEHLPTKSKTPGLQEFASAVKI
jgi:hypothetical protein